MNDLMKLLGVTAAAYMFQRLFVPDTGRQVGTAGLGQEFPSAVMPNMVIGMGPAVVPAGTFHVGSTFPLTGEAEMRINPDTGQPMWYRTTPIDQLVNDQNFYDIRNELVQAGSNVPKWVIDRERKRREEQLLNTNASGLMRTALDFDIGDVNVTPAGWTTTNMLGLGRYPRPIRRILRRKRNVMLGHLGADPSPFAPKPKTLNITPAEAERWRKETYNREMNARISAEQWKNMNPSQRSAMRDQGFIPAWETKKNGRQSVMASQVIVGGGGGPSALDIQSQYATASTEMNEKLKSLGVSKRAGITYIGGPCNMARVPKVGGAKMEDRVYEFDDCYVIVSGGGMRQQMKQAAPGAGAGGAGDGTDWYGLYDAWLKGQPYGARTTVQAAKWVGDDPSAPVATPDEYTDNKQQTQSASFSLSLQQPIYQYEKTMPYTLQSSGGKKGATTSVEELF